LTIECDTQYNVFEVILLNNLDELLDSLVLEMRRGVIILAVMSRLGDSQYGYSLVQILSDQGMSVEPGTLYPLLRRLERQGLLESNWDTSENRPRKYYRVSQQGEVIYKRLLEEWGILSKSIKSLTESGEEL
jgi:DNA-binding PadR family transcriptional regulator